MVIKSREYEQGFCKLVSTTRCRQPHDGNLFSHERILTKIKIFPKKYKKAGGKYPDLLKESFTLQNFSDSKVFRVQSSHFKFRIQNLWRRDQTGTFLLRIRPAVCKQQNESGNKTFRIRDESGKISSSVNLVLHTSINPVKFILKRLSKPLLV